MDREEEMRARLEELERENERLKSKLAAGPDAKIPSSATISLYQGKPVIRFAGSFKPFGFGLQKAKVILNHLEDIKFFVENNERRGDTEV
jgi:hypothetical protein